MEGRHTLLHKEATGVVSEISSSRFLRIQENKCDKLFEEQMGPIP